MCIFCSTFDIDGENSNKWDLLFYDSLNNQEKRLILTNLINTNFSKDTSKIDIFTKYKTIFYNEACDLAKEKYSFLKDEASNMENLDFYKLGILKLEEKETKKNIGVKTPIEIENEIAEYVIGHEDAVKRFSMLGYQQLLRAKGKFNSEQKLNSIIIGDTGSGKTHLIKSFAKVLGLPYKIIPATAITQEGWTGASISDYLEELYQKMDGEFGIVFFDEIDKITTAKKDLQLKNHLEAIQNELLTVIEGMEGKNNNGDSYNTKRMMFIFGGAFAELFDEENIKNNNRLKTIGFIQSDDPEKDIIKNKRVLEDQGIKKELLGRISSFNVLSKLTKEQLHNVLYAKDGFFDFYKKYFENHNVILSFSKDFEDSIINELHSDLKFGIREFNDILFKKLEQFMFLATKLDFSNEYKLNITNESILNPSIIYFKNNEAEKIMHKNKQLEKLKDAVLAAKNDCDSFDKSNFIFMINFAKKDDSIFQYVITEYLDFWKEIETELHESINKSIDSHKEKINHLMNEFDEFDEIDEIEAFDLR